MFLCWKEVWFETSLFEFRSTLSQQLHSSILLDFFSTFSRWWEERLDLAMISIIPQEVLKVLISIYEIVLAEKCRIKLSWGTWLKHLFANKLEKYIVTLLAFCECVCVHVLAFSEQMTKQHGRITVQISHFIH